MVYNTKDNLRYIGQSVKDGIGRFIQHLQAARRMEKSESVEYKKMMKQQLLYVHMVKIGIEYWKIYPLEQILTDEVNYKRLANIREAYWIKKLNTLTPQGLNMILPTDEDLGEPDEVLSNQITTSPSVVHPLRRFEARNIRRKLKKLNRLLEEDKFNSKVLDRYKLENIYAMHTMLENMNPEYLKIPLHNSQIIRGLLSNQLQRTKASKIIKPYQLMIVFSHKNIYYIKLQEYFNNIKWYQHLPLQLRGILPRITYKYVRTLGRITFNYMHLRNLTAQETNAIINKDCICTAKVYENYVDKNYGHIITMDCELCTDPHLRKLLVFGANFRPSIASLNVDIVYTEIKQEFTRLITKWSKEYTTHKAELQMWLNVCMEDLRRQLQILDLSSDMNLSWLKSDIVALANLQKDFVTTYMDKAPNNFTFICKKHYIQKLIHEYKLPTYEESKSSTQDLIDAHHLFAKRNGLTFEKEKYNSIRIHKA